MAAYKSKNEIAPIKLKRMPTCSSEHKEFKNVQFSLCPMFHYGVIWKNGKKQGVFFLGLSPNILCKFTPTPIHQFSTNNLFVLTNFCVQNLLKNGIIFLPQSAGHFYVGDKIILKSSISATKSQLHGPLPCVEQNP